MTSPSFRWHCLAPDDERAPRELGRRPCALPTPQHRHECRVGGRGAFVFGGGALVEEQAPGNGEDQRGEGVRLWIAVCPQAFFDGGQPIVDGHGRETIPGHLGRRERVHSGEQAYVSVRLFTREDRPGSGEGIGVVLPGSMPQRGVEELSLSSPGLDG